MAYSKKFLDILESKGLTSSKDIEEFLHPTLDHLEPIANYSGFDEARDRINKAIANDESIIVYGDYDADGVCSVAMLYDFLNKKGAKVSYFIPDRHRDGYGINLEQVEMLATNYFPDLIITVDCGITATEEIKVIQEEMGIDVIVTDHHEPPLVHPDCIILDPKIDIEKGVYADYSGAGVVFRLIEHMSSMNTALEYLDVCTISTIGDIVPLRGDNRAIASLGLNAIKNTKRLGLSLLLKKILKPGADVTSYDVSFRIVPRINSAGRLGDASEVVALFLSDDYFMMDNLVNELDEVNEERQNMTEEVVNSALEMLENIDISQKSAIVLAGDTWDSGVIGIAASRLVNIFNRPTILLAKDENNIYKGSCRSIEGVNLYKVLSSMDELFEHFGGHKMACGLSLHKDNIPELDRRLCEVIDINTTLVRANKTIPLEDKDISIQFAKELKLLEPFGQDNSDIRFIWRNNTAHFSQIGSTNHIKAKLSKDFEVVYFNALDKIDTLNSASFKDYTCKIKYSVYQNFDFVQAIVGDASVEVDKQFDDTGAVALYLKNFLRGKDSVFDIEDFDDNILKESMYGTILVAFTTSSYNRYLEMYKDYIKKTSVDSFDDINPLNTIILGLNTKTNLKYYKNIVFVDDIIHYNIVDYLLLNAGARVFTNHNIGDIIKRIEVPQYDILGKIFIAIKHLVTKNSFSNDINVLYNALRGNLDVSYLDFAIAFYTFYDLGIIKINGSRRIVIDNSVNTKLDKSVFYNELLELINNGHKC